MNARPEIPSQCTLGEGPLWYQDALWWVDIEQKVLHCYKAASGHRHQYAMPERIGFAVPASDGSWLVGLQSGIHGWDPRTGKLTRLHTPEPDQAENRFNDGKCDPAGILWAGTMTMRGQAGTAALYRVRRSRCKRMLSSVTISNGLAWDSNRAKMYYIDTPTREITVFDHDPDSGDLSNRSRLLCIPEETGAPDGMTIDSTGHLWVALWGGGGLLQIDPEEARIVTKIEVPAPNVTSCAFGGTDLQTLYITTARAGLDSATLSRFPHSGDVFSIKLPTPGLPVTPFNPR